MIKVANEITLYETDGKETSGCPLPIMIVRSHWNRNTLVVLEIAGERVTVCARDLLAAVANATNVSRL